MKITPPLIVHVIHRLDFGGLENGLVNLLNTMPTQRYRHAIVCLTAYTDFAKRIARNDVELIALNKKPGKDLSCYWRFARTLWRLKPAIVHTRNLGTLDMQFVARACGVRGRVHGEHGWDVYDLNGQNPKYLRLRRFASRVVQHYVAMSRDLADYLVRDVRVPSKRITQIYSGVDCTRFHARAEGDKAPWPAGFVPRDGCVIGTVGRMEPVKNTLVLVRAFAQLIDAVPGSRDRLRLVLVGTGPLQTSIEATIAQTGIRDLVWLAGGRNDVPDLVRQFDVFVLPSLNEGISNTLLEAMASGVPVIAGRVGGNPEIVRDGETGALYNVADERELTTILRRYIDNRSLRIRQGARARSVVEQHHSLDSMVNAYLQVYDSVCARR